MYYEWGGKGDQTYSSITLPYGDSENIFKNLLQEFEKEKSTSDGYFKPCMRCSDNASNFVTEKLSYIKNIHFLQMPLFKFVVREIKNDGKVVKYKEEIKIEKIIIFTTKIFYIFA